MQKQYSTRVEGNHFPSRQVAAMSVYHLGSNCLVSEGQPKANMSYLGASEEDFHQLRATVFQQ
jgi:hypothetical protein